MSAANNNYTKYNRTNKGGALDSGAIQSTQANAYSGGHKVLDVGPDFMKQGTPTANAYVSGRDVSGAGEPVYPGSILYLYNNNATVAWVALSTASIGAAPSSFATGIPLAPNTWTRLSAGENTFIRSSAATVGLYEVKDDTVLRVEP